MTHLASSFSPLGLTQPVTITLRHYSAPEISREPAE
jgi:hypothetical protein